MNSQVNIIDAEQIEYLPAATLLRLVERSQKATKNAVLFKKTVTEQCRMFRALEELDLTVGFCLDNEYINLSFAGDGDKLTAVWKELRRGGYNMATRPAKGDTTFNAFWAQEGYAEIFMMFSSTLCRRVKTGTKTVEVDVFETQCGELPELEPPANSVTVVDDVPL